MRNVVVLLIAVFLISGIAAASCVVVYLDENGTPYGYLHPDAYDIMSALNALPTPPDPEVAGRVLTSAVPPGTKIMDFWIEGDTAVINFSSDVAVGLEEARLMAIFEQVKNTLRQFGIEGSIKLMSDGKLLSGYLPPIQSVQPHGSGWTGIMVSTAFLTSTKLAEIAEGQYAVLRGISMVTSGPSGFRPYIELRDDDDVIVLYTPSP